jgi:hypothetical protein
VGTAKREACSASSATTHMIRSGQSGVACLPRERTKDDGLCRSTGVAQERCVCVMHSPLFFFESSLLIFVFLVYVRSLPSRPKQKQRGKHKDKTTPSQKETDSPNVFNPFYTSSCVTQVVHATKSTVNHYFLPPKICVRPFFPNSPRITLEIPKAPSFSFHVACPAHLLPSFSFLVSCSAQLNL